MKRFGTGALLSALLAAVAWSAEPLPAPSPAAPPPGSPIGRWLQPSREPLSPATRILLVAGSRDIANFAQEVVDQRRYWMQRGYTAEQIECFWAVPDPAHRDDIEQFLALEQELRSCHLATPKAVLDAIREIGARYGEEAFYLYVTSHGSHPVLQWPENVYRQIDPQGTWLGAALGEARADRSSEAFAWLGSYRIEMEAVTMANGGWGWVSFFSRYRDMHRQEGARAEEHLFTPGLLAQALRSFPDPVRKVVILQGCHSGGFVLEPGLAPTPAETLVTLPNITVLTASRADRTSFGCAGGDRTTFYGGALQQVLDELPEAPFARQDWQQVHQAVSAKVQQLEDAGRVAEGQRSLPQYFSSFRGGSDNATAKRSRRRPR